MSYAGFLRADLFPVKPGDRCGYPSTDFPPSVSSAYFSASFFRIPLDLSSRVFLRDRSANGANHNPFLAWYHCSLRSAAKHNIEKIIHVSRNNLGDRHVQNIRRK